MTRKPEPTGRILRRSHVYKSAVVALECYGHGRRRAVPVLGHDQVRFSGPGRFSLVEIFPVQQDNDIAILLDAIMQVNPISDEIMGPEDGRIIDRLISDTVDR